MSLEPIPLSLGELAAVIADMGQHVLDRDSFTGSIEYDCMDGPPCSVCRGERNHPDTGAPCAACEGWGSESLPEGKDFWVHGVYRIGNSQGQGGVRMIGEVIRP